MRVSLFVSIVAALAVPAAGQPESRSQLPFSACFAPGTPWSKVLEHANAEPVGLSAMGNSVRAASGGPEMIQFNDSDRWSRTATDGPGLQQGDPTTLTWSIVPDGTSIHGYAGEPVSDSDLRAVLNARYGSEAVWLPLIQSVFDRWSELNGVTYVYEPNDDGDAWTSATIASGQLGVRGDVRISGHPIDGNSGILAYNFFPNFGDMVLDTSDGFFNNTADNSLRLRNVIAHEHGHGLGLPHTCPVDQTKLMEPFATTAFDGPQHDDILSSQRGYGDWIEHDDTTGTSTDLGQFTGSKSENGRSIDDDSDADYYRFSAFAGDMVDVTVTPVGWTYLNGKQNNNGSCSAGTSFDSLRQNDIGLELIDVDGTSMLAMSTSNPAGVPESVTDEVLEQTGTYYVRVLPGFENAAQLYDFAINLTDGSCSQADLDLTAQTIDTTESFSNCTIRAGDGFEIVDGGNVQLNAGKKVVLRNGFSVGGGTLQINLDPSLIQ